MQEEKMRYALEQANSITSEKAIRSRISKGKTVEEILGESMDIIVKDDYKMYKALLRLKQHPRERNGVLQNSLRWYYKIINLKEFPSLLQYERIQRL